ncbi:MULTISPECIES: hypothetical protein [Chitinophagaceae]|uniref:hypothetical protein n=1 Tax=Chitinophagaceae TaxID=563835 RepID=UPI000DEF69C8|nr:MULTISPECIES: hypothetical protein [Chitinophagaceae]RPD48920.1 hypothetical protein DRJ53_09680 [Paracnuella aquatica]
MERVFTTHFEFHGKTYTTRVHQQVAPRHMQLQIEVPDQSLLHLLPDGKIVYSSDRGLEPSPDVNSYMAHELIGCIVRSVEPHIDAV